MTFDLTGLTEKVIEGRWKTVYYEDSSGVVLARTCTRCGEVKPLYEYNNSRSGFAGKKSYCKECNKERTRKYYKENASKLREYARKYYKENAEEVREYTKKYYRKNIEARRKYNQKHRENNKEYYRELFRKWRNDNKEKIREYDRLYRARRKDSRRLYEQRRRARKALLPDTLTEAQRLEIFDFFDGKCSLSDTAENIHMDHVIPLITGHGGTIYENIIPLRDDLNLSKNDRNIFEWFADNRERFGLSQRKFDELIEYLADINEMTVEEYRDYVYWCHDNPRTLDEIEVEKEGEASS